MGLFNLLETGIPVFGQTFDVSLNWIGNLIRWLCNSVGVVGVGIILFSLVLKLITLPFDIYQRISMRKQNIQMKANQEKMEALQKQYANDKDTYNKKVSEMYKANGMSMFSSCLPMILSMVIFIVAINAFNAYAQYSNVENYNVLVDAYNTQMTAYCPELTTENYDSLVTVTVTDDKDGNGQATGSKTVTYLVKDSTAGNFLYYKAYQTVAAGEEYTPLEKSEAYRFVRDYANKAYFVDVDRAIAEDAAVKAYVDTAMPANPALTKEEAVHDYLVGKAQDAVVVAYEEKVTKNTGFLWIKNIWVTDASYKHPVMSANDFATEAKREEFKVPGRGEDTKSFKEVKYSKMSEYTNVYTDTAYNHITAKLDVQKKAANGYFVLIALSIGTILLQQFIMQRSQKEQQKFSSVDGQAASTQKMTMVIMTGMFAIFSFMYSSAFSIYMITSNIFSMVSTLVINLFVDKKAERKDQQATVKRYENHAQDRIEAAKQAGRQSAEDAKKKK